MVANTTPAPVEIDVGAGLKAWFVACVAVSGTVSLFVGMGLAPVAPLVFIIALVVTMALTGIPAILLVNLVRGLGLTRGYTDAGIPAVLSLLVSAAWLDGDPAAFLFARLGALGGSAYWVAAGKPRANQLMNGETS